MPKVSVIVPVYNVEKYIDKSLKSLVNQTLDEIEIIIVNDGSTDSSKEIIDKYLKKYSYKIKYYEKQNGGLSSARNFGLNYATGEYVAFLDSDDYVEKDMYKTMYERAKKDNADMVECDFVWEYDSKQNAQEIRKKREYQKQYKQKKDKKKKYKNKRAMMKRPRVVAWNKIIRREIIEKNNIKFPEGLIYEDIEFFYKLIPYINRISYVDEYFVHYVQRENSLSNLQTAKVEDIFIILDNIFQYYKSCELYNKYYKELNYMYKRILLGSSLKRILKIKNNHLRKKLLKKTFYYLINNNKMKQCQNLKLEADTICGRSYKIEDILSNESSLIFGITKLGIGGAERVLVDMANKLCNKYEITIFTIYKGGELEKEVDKRVRIVALYEKKNWILPIYLLIFGKHVYKKNIKNKFDVEIAFLEGAITRIFSYNGNARKIAWVHNDIKNVFGHGGKAYLKKKIDKKIYKRYDTIVFVSKDNQKTFNELYGNEFNEKVIYNYIDKNRVLRMADEDAEDMIKIDKEPIILSVARLVSQKGLDRFIKIHKKIINDGIAHRVYVIGEGEEKANLQRLIKELNVEDTFILLGKRENPYPYIKQCDFFALLSYYEGYGMAVEEAKIFKKKIIVTDTAAKEAVQDYEEGTIAQNNEEDIYIKLKGLLLEYKE